MAPLRFLAVCLFAAASSFASHSHDPVMPGLLFPLSLEFPEGPGLVTIDVDTELGALPQNCTAVSPTRAQCAVTRPSANAVPRLTVDVFAPDESESYLHYEVSIGGSSIRKGVVPTYRTYFVTTTADSGTASLRAAIAWANATCLSEQQRMCAIAFRIPERTRTWHTIRLSSPLPAITARALRIDAGTQGRYRGDMNPHGPEIELDGSALSEGDGLRLVTQCGDVQVRGFAINGFPGSGIALVAGFSCNRLLPAGIVADNYIGCDPTGRRAVPNERGIWVGEPNWALLQNVIGGNRRSGIFVETGAPAIHRNVIGLTPTLTAPLPNGASGIYIGRSGGSVVQNHIGFNRHAGLFVAPGVEFLRISGNSFQANDQLAIDHGLDGISPSAPMLIPEILRARYENGVTLIEIRADPRVKDFGVFVDIYANDAPDPSGYGEGQYHLANVLTKSGTLTYAHRGDLRGKWITATSMQIESTISGDIVSLRTSEFSRALEVQ